MFLTSQPLRGHVGYLGGHLWDRGGHLRDLTGHLGDLEGYHGDLAGHLGGLGGHLGVELRDLKAILAPPYPFKGVRRDLLRGPRGHLELHRAS